MEENPNKNEEMPAENIPQDAPQTSETNGAPVVEPQPGPQMYQQPYPMPNQQPAYQPPYQQPYPVQPKEPRLRRNFIGGTGFVLGVVGIVLFWLPYVRFILGVLGLTMSLVDIFRRNCRRAFPIAGLILSSLVLLIIAIIWYHFDYTLTDIFNDDFLDFLNFLDK